MEIKIEAMPDVSGEKTHRKKVYAVYEFDLECGQIIQVIHQLGFETIKDAVTWALGNNLSFWSFWIVEDHVDDRCKGWADHAARLEREVTTPSTEGTYPITYFCQHCECESGYEVLMSKPDAINFLVEYFTEDQRSGTIPPQLPLKPCPKCEQKEGR